METVRAAMEWASFALDTLAVTVIVAGTVAAAIRCGGVVSRFKHGLVESLLLGLDLLVASDVIHTAAIEPTLYSVATLGLLVMVRIALTWSLVVEAEGRWPWQPRGESR